MALRLTDSKPLVHEVSKYTIKNSQFCSLHFSWTCLAGNIVSAVPLATLDGQVLNLSIRKQSVVLPVLLFMEFKEAFFDGSMLY